MDSKIAATFDQFTPEVRQQLLAARDLIFETAEELKVGPLTECLRWGQPSYLTQASKSGTMIRLGSPKNQPENCALFVHCQTSLISEFRETIEHPSISFEGNRAIHFSADAPLPAQELSHCISQALVYKRR